MTGGAGEAPARKERGGTSIERIDLACPEEGLLRKAAALLGAGEAVVFPTDTVYGIGVLAGEGRAPDLLFAIKRRDREQTIPWLVASPADIERYGRDLAPQARRLAERFWPGPLTLVVRASDAVPQAFVGGDGTIALRMPDSPVPLGIMRAAAAPLAATSANLHGMPAVDDARLLDPALVSRVPLVLDGGRVALGVPSTIVSCATRTPTILREGFVTASDVAGAC